MSKEGTGLILISTEPLTVTHLALVKNRYRSYSSGSYTVLQAVI
jgi:hypothetical protein